jgi:hypothetical protein
MPPTVEASRVRHDFRSQIGAAAASHEFTLYRVSGQVSNQLLFRRASDGQLVSLYVLV